MGHGKLRKFAEMETMSNVVQAPLNARVSPLSLNEEMPQANFQKTWDKYSSPMKGNWAAFFNNLKGSPSDSTCNSRPLVLELGCGRGEYTIGLARRFPDTNFLGVDIKGARMWHGAREAASEGLTNAAFLRTRIEFIDRFFDCGEVSEIWLTFSDPQMKKPTKRLTSTTFLERYRRIMPDGGLIHLKTDSQFLFDYTRALLQANNIKPEASIDDIHASSLNENDELALLRDVRTYYEEMWLQRGISVKYLRFRLPQTETLVEPDVEIPLDNYRSYNRHKRGSKETSK